MVGRSLNRWVDMVQEDAVNLLGIIIKINKIINPWHYSSKEPRPTEVVAAK